jgi:hypothetical protein
MRAHRRSRSLVLLFLLGPALPAGLALWLCRPSPALTDLVYATADGTPLTLRLFPLAADLGL